MSTLRLPKNIFDSLKTFKKVTAPRLREECGSLRALLCRMASARADETYFLSCTRRGREEKEALSRLRLRNAAGFFNTLSSRRPACCCYFAQI